MIEKFMLASTIRANPLSLSAEMSKVDKVRVSNHFAGSKISKAWLTRKNAPNGAANVATPGPIDRHHGLMVERPSRVTVRHSRTGSSISRRGFNVMALPSHPKHAELRRRNGRVQRRRKTQRQHPTRLRRRDDAVVPQPRGGVIGIALGFVLVADRLLEFFFLDLGPGLAGGFDIVAPHRGQHARGLLAAHHRDAGVRPGEQETRAIGAAAHAVIAGAVGAADD